ncbi:hypothetical protein [Bradyrhizobium prioriisuperbiae]|uniref:hypothetical protein n=1 Tax=Bradyrhizobium prioriisuperbiae TaxID=2854389 RepID=UPI0038990DE8
MRDSGVANLDSETKGTPTRLLRDALRKARIEAADRTAVVVDLRDAEVARLEILNEALDPLFSEIPGNVELFDRGISHGDTPRLWVDAVAHVVMGRDKRAYRFVQDTRFGRLVLAESHDVKAMVSAVTDYVARRIIEREHALVSMPMPAVPAATAKAVEAAYAAATSAANSNAAPAQPVQAVAKTSRKGVWTFALGFVAGMAALFAVAFFAALRTF